jgi:hypothetical protein
MNENVDYPSTRLLLTHKICSSYDMISIYKIVVVSVVCFTYKTQNPIMLTLISLWTKSFTLLFSLLGNITQDYFLFINFVSETITFSFHFQFSIHPTTCRRVLEKASNFHALKHNNSNLMHLPFHHRDFSYLAQSIFFLWPLNYNLTKVLPYQLNSSPLHPFPFTLFLFILFNKYDFFSWILPKLPRGKI